MTRPHHKWISLLVAHLVFACLVLALPALGAPIKWNAAVDGNWDDAKKWDTGTVPGARDDASNMFVSTITVRQPTVVGSFDTKGILHVAAPFAAIGGVKLDPESGVINLRGGELNTTTVAYANDQAPRAGSGVAIERGSTLNKATLEVNAFLARDIAVTVKNDLTLGKTSTFAMGNDSVIEFDGNQVLTGGKLRIGSGTLGLTPGTDLKINGTGFEFASQANAVLGQTSPNPMTPTQITVESSLWTSSLNDMPGSITVSPDRFVIQRSLAIHGAGYQYSFNTREFLNDSNGDFVIRNLAGRTTESKITTDSFVNKGRFEVTSTGNLTVSGKTGLQQATNAGKLIVDKDSKLNFRSGLLQEGGETTVNGDLNVQRGIFLGGSVTGSGKIVGNVSMTGGTLQPGNSPGLLSILGAYDQSATSSLEIELGGDIVDSLIGRFDYDRLAIDGPASLGGLLDVTLIDGFTPDNDDIFTILTTTGSLNGVFENAVPASAFAPAFLDMGVGTFEVHYNRGLDGLSTVTLSNFRAVPEPSTLSLLAIGTIGLLSYDWCRRKPVR